MTADASGPMKLWPAAATINVGHAALTAPLRPPSHTQGTYGEMWQWIGDGRSLFSLLLVARCDGEESTTGVRHRLLAEVERISKPIVPCEDETVRTEIAIVAGARAAFVAHVDGIREGVPVRNLVTAAATYERTYFLHVLVPDTQAGHEQASSVASSLRLAG
ncbi:hypothetical protein [Nocardioides sp. NPDC127503]|uniref:hypothetical protein n=1 Tax=Nocardioides sp. NPDC127503 TaxID=3154516 RepID=UPI00332503F0